MRVRTLHALGVAMMLVTAAVTLGTALVPATHAPEAFCPTGATPDPNVIFCDDFEDRAFPKRWEIGSNKRRWPASQFVRCADEQFGFGDRCAAWSNHLVFDGAWGFYGYDGRRSFSPAPEFYVRWYQHISDPFMWGTLEDKTLLLQDSHNTLIVYVATSRNQLPHEPNSGPGMPFVANYQDLDWRETAGQFTKVNRFQNRDRNITLQPGRWYLFEWYVKLNTPGVSDGATKLWIDDATQPLGAQTLRMDYTDMRWLRSGDSGKQLGVLRLTLYHQRCDGSPHTCPPKGPETLHQSHRWDRIVVSRKPIGPVVGTPAPTSTR